MPNYTLTPLTGTFGAEVKGADILRDFAPGELKQLLQKHLVLVFRGCPIDRTTQVAVARSIGEPTPAHPVVPGDPKHPEILELDGAKGGRNARWVNLVKKPSLPRLNKLLHILERWHTDVTFIPTPPAFSVLVADELPPYGGDTIWCDLRTSYERLNPAIQKALENFNAVHRITPLAYWGEPADTAMTRDDAEAMYQQSANVPPVLHPVVRRDPETGKKTIFVNPGFTSHIPELSRIESDNVLKMLFEHCTQPEMTLRHRWANGDIVMWNNMMTAHWAVDDYGTVTRKMRRVTVRGELPQGVDGRKSKIVDDPLVRVRL